MEPKFSVIIPAYKGASFIGQAIRSALDQTYSNLELIVVDDASPDQTGEVVQRFKDRRVIYIRHEKNQGVVEARNSGLRFATGDLIAFLDQDDYFHPEKLASHARLHQEHPEIGFSYNARFELDYSADTIREIWRPPAEITLADLVLGFPIAPSEIVVKRPWAVQMMEKYRPHTWTGGEILRYGGLFLDGCKFGYVDRALNYRRHHSGRLVKDLIGGCQSEIACQEAIFNDPRCPAEVLALRPQAHAGLYAYWAFLAYRQGETAIGRDLLCRALLEYPAILSGEPSELLSLFLVNSIDDENLDHTALLKRIFDHLPPGVPWGRAQLEWAIGRGYLLKGLRNLMWGRLEKGGNDINQAIHHHPTTDLGLLQQLARMLVDYAKEFGEQSADRVYRTWAAHLKKLSSPRFLAQLKSAYKANLAFENYRQHHYRQALGELLSSITNDPDSLRNRGVQSVFVKSLVKAGFSKALYIQHSKIGKLGSGD